MAETIHIMYMWCSADAYCLVSLGLTRSLQHLCALVLCTRAEVSWDRLIINFDKSVSSLSLFQIKLYPPYFTNENNKACENV